MSSKVKAKARQSISLGYKLSSEEQTPSDLVRYAHMAEESGFTLVRGGHHGAALLRLLIRERLADGRLPSTSIPRVGDGPGNG